jgi:hypothetical protein
VPQPRCHLHRATQNDRKTKEKRPGLKLRPFRPWRHEEEEEVAVALRSSRGRSRGCLAVRWSR